MGGFSKIVPKDYPTSPDIEDRRHEHPDTGLSSFLSAPKAEDSSTPEIVIRSRPASYKAARQKRKEIQ